METKRVSYSEPPGRVLMAARDGAPGPQLAVLHAKAIDEETRCSNSAQRANSAPEPCHPTPPKRASAATNAHSVHGASNRSSRTCVQTAAAGSCPGQSGHRRTGRATTFSAHTPQARTSGIDLSIPRPTQGSPPQSRTFHRSGDRGAGQRNLGRLSVTQFVTRYASGGPRHRNSGEEWVGSKQERPVRPAIAVPTNVPAVGSQNRALGANSSQIGRSRK